MSGKRFSGTSWVPRSICSKTLCMRVPTTCGANPETSEGFAPPAPFTLDEFDPAGLLPERPYTKDELQRYLNHCRQKCRASIEALEDERPSTRRKFSWGEVSAVELMLYNMRHVQHHVAQLNLLLRQTIDSAPRWVARARS
jgi:hypothetical protein